MPKTFLPSAQRVVLMAAHDRTRVEAEDLARLFCADTYIRPTDAAWRSAVKAIQALILKQYLVLSGADTYDITEAGRRYYEATYGG